MNHDLYLLDSGPLGLASNPRASEDAGRCLAWMQRVLNAGSAVMVPDVVCYEVRRELIRAGKTKGLARLDSLVEELGRIPIGPSAWDFAAELWAHARRDGKPTAKEDALDADVLVAAVAHLAAEDGWIVVVVSDKPGHLGRFATVADWRTLAGPSRVE